MSFIYKIYSLADPRDNKIFYIGLADYNLKSRLSGHINDCKRINNPKNTFIRQMIFEGFTPIISSIEQSPYKNGRKAALQLEQKWISFYLSKGVNLLNTRGNPLRKQVARPRKKKMSLVGLIESLIPFY